MKFIFIVQGEGRGHITQAIALSDLLKKEGHELGAVLIGKSKRRSIPEYFKKQISCPIISIESPNFVTDKANKTVQIRKTITSNLWKTTHFLKSLKQIDRTVQDYQPDVILNFYDLLGGLYNALFRPSAQFWVIGHQYLINHPNFTYAKSSAFAKQCFQLNTWITSLGAQKCLALSFYEMESNSLGKLQVMPPLLRKEVKSLTPTSKDFILAYMVNCGYAEEVISYAKKYPHLRIKAYWDKKGAAEVTQALPNLSFHQVHDQHFLQDMAACKGLVCTAGFESVCEAMYLGKPIMVIPVKGQYEQACNALDTSQSGIGVTSENFDFSKLESIINQSEPNIQSHQIWIDSFSQVFNSILEENKKTEPVWNLTQSYS